MFASELCTELCLLIAAMQMIAHITVADIHLHAAKKKAATDVGPSRPSKRTRGESGSVPARESDIPSVIAPDIEPVIALSVPTMLPPIEVPLVRVEMVRDEDAALEPSTILSVGFGSILQSNQNYLLLCKPFRK